MVGENPGASLDFFISIFFTRNDCALMREWCN